MMDTLDIIQIPIKALELNKGQIEGLPKNPRFIKDARYAALVKSIADSPEMLRIRELMVVPHGDKYVVIGGNMRLRACKELGFKEVPCKVLPPDTPVEKLREYAMKDNENYGQTDWDIIANEWDEDELEDWGIEIPTDWGNYGDMSANADDDDDADNEEADDDDDEEDEKDEFYNKMFRDVLFPSDNIYDIPNLMMEHQAGHLELPLSPWGANSRLRKDVATYHFYVDDYRFEHLFRDPIALLTSGCKAIAEPNCSLHDQTPLAYGLSLIYKKRWLARYLQECGINVYVDLNVSHKFIEYNKMGVPKGYNAFMTRGLTGWMESLKSDLKVAQEISGLETPNLLVYGGGREIQDFCMQHGLLYVTDFINAKKQDNG